MGNTVWKQFERQMAQFWGGVRNPLSGSSSRHTGGDLIHPTIYGEAKYMKVFPKKFRNTWEESQKNAKNEGKIAVLCLKEKNMKGFLVVMHSDDIERLLTMKEILR